MKKSLYLSLYFNLFFVACFQMGLKAQLSTQPLNPGMSVAKTVISSRDLVISSHETCMLIFPAAIQSADRGEAYVLASRVRGTENVLKVKAGKPGFMPSSLTVVTSDGQVFAFRVSYAAHPPYLVLDFRRMGVGIGIGIGIDAVQFKGALLNSAQMQRCAALARGRKSIIKGVHWNRRGLDFGLEGIFIHRDVLFFKFRLHNASSIPYRFEALRYYIRDLKTAKRTAVRDNEVKALYRQSWGSPEDVGGQVIVVALHRFTMAENKCLVIDLRENQGDRSAVLRLKQRKLLKTVPLE